jgi:hypothetical protein
MLHNSIPHRHSIAHLVVSRLRVATTYSFVQRTPCCRQWYAPYAGCVHASRQRPLLTRPTNRYPPRTCLGGGAGEATRAHIRTRGPASQAGWRSGEYASRDAAPGAPSGTTARRKPSRCHRHCVRVESQRSVHRRSPGRRVSARNGESRLAAVARSAGSTAVSACWVAPEHGTPRQQRDVLTFKA